MKTTENRSAVCAQFLRAAVSEIRATVFDGEEEITDIAQAMLLAKRLDAAIESIESVAEELEGAGSHQQEAGEAE